MRFLTSAAIFVCGFATIQFIDRRRGSVAGSLALLLWALASAVYRGFAGDLLWTAINALVAAAILVLLPSDARRDRKREA